MYQPDPLPILPSQSLQHNLPQVPNPFILSLHPGKDRLLLESIKQVYQDAIRQSTFPCIEAWQGDTVWRSKVPKASKRVRDHPSSYC